MAIFIHHCGRDSGHRDLYRLSFAEMLFRLAIGECRWSICTPGCIRHVVTLLRLKTFHERCMCFRHRRSLILNGQMTGLDHSREIRAAQVRLLYEQLPSALLATIVNATILIAILWREVSPAALMGWLLVVLAVALGRYGHRRSYLGSPSANTDSLDWERRHIYGVAANGALWGLAGFSFFTPHSYVHQVFLAFVLMGMASGSISTLSSSRRAYLVFLMLALSP
jgi:hypothetical protein